MAITQPMIMMGPATVSESPTSVGARLANGMASRPRIAAKTLKVTRTRSVPNATVGM